MNKTKDNEGCKSLTLSLYTLCSTVPLGKKDEKLYEVQWLPTGTSVEPIRAVVMDSVLPTWPLVVVAMNISGCVNYCI